MNNQHIADPYEIMPSVIESHSYLAYRAASIFLVGMMLMADAIFASMFDATRMYAGPLYFAAAALLIYATIRIYHHTGVADKIAKRNGYNVDHFNLWKRFWKESWS